ncbi:DUF305 domain-containing protein [Streptomyces sp. LP05-1]|uniref:DUF305 domain-containing protein n=1 Tax=Streptomyces pyxinae TaxID=2970734 RepID=A0ABT2CHR6_9ACTN|nr:DUF305 domain-containing protein [Streptomyces sp. LP05-1]MCS0636957.1 DUF305 domain-containing protein [Streptomyces sp. LP05-1]
MRSLAGAARAATAVPGIAGLAAVLLLSACGPDPATGTGKPGADSGATGSVVAPGRPGEPARTLSPEDAARAVPADTPNGADFRYTQMMIVHHGQALEMAALAPQRAESRQVKKVAARIAAGQAPEIGAMRGWLRRNGGPRPQPDHGHHAMPGMATPAQLARLRAARGSAFDELFLKLMITHHQGAITMATEVLGQGNNVQVEEMAGEVLAQQTAEIGRMRAM